MVELFIGVDNIPDTERLIYDIDPVITSVDIEGTPLQRRVLAEVEHGEYFDATRFKDRFGNLLYYSELSTGSKAIIIAEVIPDMIVNFTECGDNALMFISLLDNAKVYLDACPIGLPWERDIPIICNGKLWERISRLNDYLA